MPYIPQQRRDRFAVNKIRIPEDAGELNYVITKLIRRYLSHHGRKYQTMNEIVGVLECAKHEFQRRTVDPYEHLKMLEHGDVL